MTDTRAAAFGTRLKNLRETAGLTQAELARRAYVSRSYIAHIETGRNMPGIELVERFSQILDVEVNDLLDSDSKRSKADSPRDLFFASRSDKLTEEQWQVLRALIDQFARE